MMFQPLGVCCRLGTSPACLLRTEVRGEGAILVQDDVAAVQDGALRLDEAGRAVHLMTKMHCAILGA